MMALLLALAIQEHPFEGLKKGDRIQVNYAGGDRLTGWITTIARDRKTLGLDVSHDYPEIKGVMRVEAARVDSIRKLEAADPEEQARRVAAAGAELAASEARRKERELLFKKVAALPFEGTVSTAKRGVFTVTSDAGPVMAAKVAEHLVKIFEDYDGFLKGRDPERTFSVLLYSSEKAFATYWEQATGQPFMATLRAFYYPHDNALVLWYGEDDQLLMGQLRHEAFHAFVHGLRVHPPAWFNEGMAVHFETSTSAAVAANEKRSFELGLLKKAGALVSREKLMAVGHKDYMFAAQKIDTYQVPLYYAQGWSFVRFMMSDPARRGILSRFFSALKEGKEDAEAWAAASKGVDVAALEKEWEQKR